MRPVAKSEVVKLLPIVYTGQIKYGSEYRRDGIANSSGEIVFHACGNMLRKRLMPGNLSPDFIYLCLKPYTCMDCGHRLMVTLDDRVILFTRHLGAYFVSQQLTHPVEATIMQLNGT